jgi:hypothetical protein
MFRTEVAEDLLTCCGPVSDFSVDPMLVADPYPQPNQTGSGDFFCVPTNFPDLSLSPDEAAWQQQVFIEVSSEQSVERAMDQLLLVGDTATWSHCYRVGYLMAAGATRLGMTEDEAKIACRMGLLHDVGKSDPAVQEAIHTRQRMNSSLLAVIMTHPWHGVRIARALGIGGNEQQGIGNHHALQTQREPYGVFQEIVPLPEADGRQPDLRRLVGLTACCDVYDAIALEPEIGGRAYQQDGTEVYDHARLENVLSSLATSDPVKEAVLSLRN